MTHFASSADVESFPITLQIEELFSPVHARRDLPAQGSLSRYVPANHSSNEPHASMLPWAVLYVPSSCEETPASCQAHQQTLLGGLLWRTGLKCREDGQDGGRLGGLWD